MPAYPPHTRSYQIEVILNIYLTHTEDQVALAFWIGVELVVKAM